MGVCTQKHMALIIIGFVLSVMAISDAVVLFDQQKVEKQMIEKCLSVESKLESYNSVTLYCTDGFSHERI
jgi:hypothetical protein